VNDDSDPSCPQCHAALAATDPRFTTWCPACDWNVDPGDTPARREQSRRRSELARHERAFSRVAAEHTAAAPRKAAAWYAAIVLATAVNLVTVAVAGAGVWLLISGTWPERVIGAVALVIAVVLRPRLGRVPRHALDRTAAPTLHAVAERVTAELGTRPVDLIALDARYGSGYLTAGPRRTRVLVLGLPLWVTLTMDQRLALFGRELGHATGRGRRSASWIATALDSLTVWSEVFRPGPIRQSPYLDVPSPDGRRRSGGLATVGELAARPVLTLLRQGTRVLHRLLSTLSDQSGAQAAYLADAAAARVATAPSTESLLRAQLLNETAMRALERLTRGTGEIWDELRTYLASVPETERARQLRRSELRGGNPPTYLRIAFVHRLPHAAAAVSVSEAEEKAIDAELAPVLASIAEELRVCQGR
jgi:hypothetical protein